MNKSVHSCRLSQGCIIFYECHEEMWACAICVTWAAAYRTVFQSKVLLYLFPEQYMYSYGAGLEKDFA